MTLALSFAAPADPARADEALAKLSKDIVTTTQTDGNHAKFFAANFEAALARRYRELEKKPNPGLLDFDIVTFSQDPDLPSIRKSIKSEIVPKSPTQAIIRVRFLQGARETMIDYDTRKIGAAWKIHDVIYVADKLSLRRKLKVK